MSDIKDAGGISSSLPIPLEDEGPEFWLNHLENWKKSGSTQAAYCRRHNLKYITFRRWKRQLSTYPSKSSIKLVEVRRDLSLNAKSPSPGPFGPFGPGSIAGSNYANTSPGHAEIKVVRNASGIRFWCGEFCIEIDVPFSSESLCQLIRTLRTLQGLQVTNPNAVNTKDRGSK